ncbi:hypothetical protein BDZ89DRAFT_722969 [Hymenopellis radicata]|nr:hypothetical protein BDZ89DRAFT_722969 [Hymenopellis radicata]
MSDNTLPPDTIRTAMTDVWPKLHPAHQASSSTVPSIHMNTASLFNPTSPLTHTKRNSAVLLNADASRTHLNATIGHDSLTPVPRRYAMHLHPTLLLKHVQSLPDLPMQLGALVDEALDHDTYPIPSSRPQKLGDVVVPSENIRFSRTERERDCSNWLKVSIDSVAQLPTVFAVREQLVAAITSVLISGSSELPDEGEGILRWSSKSTTLRGNAEDLPPAGGYFTLHTPSESDSRCENLEKFSLSDIVVVDFQAVAGPLRPYSLFSAMQKVVKEGLQWRWRTCDAEKSVIATCASDRCRRFPELDEASVSGRPTGFDSEVVFGMIIKCLENALSHAGDAAPSGNLPPEVIAMVSFFWQELWAKAVAVDASCMILCSGDHEIICLRVRSTQTMFISDTLDIQRSPTSPIPPHIKLHCGVALLAYNDVVARLQTLTTHANSGRLPGQWLFDYDGDIDLANPSVPSSIKRHAYNLTTGSFLPMQRLPNPRTQGNFSQVQHTISKASEIVVHLKAGISPATSLTCTRSPPLDRSGTTLHLRIHCRLRHSQKVFLCYLERSQDSPSGAGEPYGIPFVIKFSQDIVKLREEEGILRRLSSLPPLENCQVYTPRSFGGVFVQDTDRPEFAKGFFLMEHCNKCPIGIADTINDRAADDINTWLSAIHKAGFTHNQLSDCCIL